MVDALSIDGSGGSVGRAVAHYSDSNVTVQGTRHLVEGTLEPIVRLLFLISAKILPSLWVIANIVVPKRPPALLEYGFLII